MVSCQHSHLAETVRTNHTKKGRARIFAGDSRLNAECSQSWEKRGPVDVKSECVGAKYPWRMYR